MSAGHTPGPWQVAGCRHSGDLKIGRDTRLHAVGPDGDAVAMVFYDMKTGRGLKDARLIAAAPELLEALQRLLDGLPFGGMTSEYEMVQAGCDPTEARRLYAAFAAIAKATGA